MDVGSVSSLQLRRTPQFPMQTTMLMLMSLFIPCLMTTSLHCLFPKGPVPALHTPTFTPIDCTFTQVCCLPLLNCNPILTMVFVIYVCYCVQIRHLHHAEEKEAML